jgi:hypothetical protein
MEQTLGQKLSPIIDEICNTILERQVFNNEHPKLGGPIGFNTMDMLNAVNILSACALDVAWVHQDKKSMDQELRIAKAERFGTGLSKLIYEFCDIDTQRIYKSSE